MGRRWLVCGSNMFRVLHGYMIEGAMGEEKRNVDAAFEAINQFESVLEVGLCNDEGGSHRSFFCGGSIGPYGSDRFGLVWWRCCPQEKKMAPCC